MISGYPSRAEDGTWGVYTLETGRVAPVRAGRGRLLRFFRSGTESRTLARGEGTLHRLRVALVKGARGGVEGLKALDAFSSWKKISLVAPSRAEMRHLQGGSIEPVS